MSITCRTVSVVVNAKYFGLYAPCCALVREAPQIVLTNLRFSVLSTLGFATSPSRPRSRQLEELNTEALVLEERAALLTAVCNGVEQFCRRRERAWQSRGSRTD